MTFLPSFLWAPSALAVGSVWAILGNSRVQLEAAASYTAGTPNTNRNIRTNINGALVWAYALDPRFRVLDPYISTDTRPSSAPRNVSGPFAGINGDTYGASTGNPSFLARIPTEAAGAEGLVLLDHVNESILGYDVATTKARILAGVNLALDPLVNGGAGARRVVVCTAFGATAAATSFTTAQRTAMVAVNAWLLDGGSTGFLAQLGARAGRVAVADLAAAMATDAGGFVDASLCTDSRHQNAKGAKRMGRALTQVLARLIAPGNAALALLRGSGNLLNNPNFATTTTSTSGLGSGMAFATTALPAGAAANMPANVTLSIPSGMTAQVYTRPLTAAEDGAGFANGARALGIVLNRNGVSVTNAAVGVAFNTITTAQQPSIGPTQSGWFRGLSRLRFKDTAGWWKVPQVALVSKGTGTGTSNNVPGATGGSNSATDGPTEGAAEDQYWPTPPLWLEVDATRSGIGYTASVYLAGDGSSDSSTIEFVENAVLPAADPSMIFPVPSPYSIVL